NVPDAQADVVHWDGVRWTPFGDTAKLSLNAVWGSGPDDVWGVGPGTIAHFDGTSWVVAMQDLPATLTGLWGSGPDDVWAVGNNASAVHFDGVKWSEGIVLGSSFGSLSRVWGTGPDDVWAVGTDDLVTRRGTIWRWDATMRSWRTVMTGIGWGALAG